MKVFSLAIAARRGVRPARASAGSQPNSGLSVGFGSARDPSGHPGSAANTARVRYFAYVQHLANSLQNRTGTCLGRNPGRCPSRKRCRCAFTLVPAQVLAGHRPTGAGVTGGGRSQLPRPLQAGPTCRIEPASIGSATYPDIGLLRAELTNHYFPKNQTNLT